MIFHSLNSIACTCWDASCASGKWRLRSSTWLVTTCIYWVKGSIWRFCGSKLLGLPPKKIWICHYLIWLFLLLLVPYFWPNELELIFESYLINLDSLQLESRRRYHDTKTAGFGNHLFCHQKIRSKFMRKTLMYLEPGNRWRNLLLKKSKTQPSLDTVYTMFIHIGGPPAQ